MAEPLKNLYNPVFFEKIIPIIKDVLPDMDEREFIFSVFDETWPDLELKQRVRKIALSLKRILPADFRRAAREVQNLSDAFLQRGIREQGFEMIFLPDFIGLFGEKHLHASLTALGEITRLVSAEFAIRNFLLISPEETLQKMVKWSEHENPHVRRLATEGCRPRLPWAMGVPWLKHHPEKILPILENLREDPSEYVRRSVANNLNDIAKDHPTLVLNVAEKWRGKSPLTDQIIRHGCRTLLKKGNHKSLNLHGINPESRFEICSLSLSGKKVKRGGDLFFEMNFKNMENVTAKFRLDYAIDFITASGKTSTRIFKLKEKEFDPHTENRLTWKQSFKDFTTRKQFTGKHFVHIRVNGKTEATKEFFVY